MGINFKALVSDSLKLPNTFAKNSPTQAQTLNELLLCRVTCLGIVGIRFLDILFVLLGGRASEGTDIRWNITDTVYFIFFKSAHCKTPDTKNHVVTFIKYKWNPCSKYETSCNSGSYLNLGVVLEKRRKQRSLVAMPMCDICQSVSSNLVAAVSGRVCNFHTHATHEAVCFWFLWPPSQ